MTSEQLKEKFTENNLSNFWDNVRENLKNSIPFHVKNSIETDINIGSSKIGGLPDLPKNTNWFFNGENPMSFIAQINFSELSQFDIDGKLPKTGILYLFYDTEQPWGYDPKDKDGKVVYFYNGNFNELERKEKPHDLDDYYLFKPSKISFQSNVVEAPDYWSDLIDFELNEDEVDRYWELKETITPPKINKILGHSNNIQGGMELECELVTNGIYCGDSSGYDNPKRKELEKGISKWQLLLQIDSNEEENDMMWGDDGRIYLWIKEDDLLNEKFENSWLILQCY